MEPTKKDDDASSSEPAANHSVSPTKLGLGASPPDSPAACDIRLQAMQLGGPSSSRQPPRSTGPTSLPLLLPHQAPKQGQGLARTAVPDEVQMLQEPRRRAGGVTVSIPHHSEHGLLFAAPDLTCPRFDVGQYQASASNHQPRLYEEAESSTRAGYVSPRIVGSIPRYGEPGLRFATLGLPYPPVAETQIQSQQRQLMASAGQYQPSASYPQAGAAADLFAAASRLRGYGAFNPYAYAFAHQSTRTLQEFRANLLRAEEPMVDAMISRSSEQVVQLLAAGDEEVRLFILVAVTPDNVHHLMKRSDMYAVFVALLRACEERHDELGLRSIAHAAASSSGAGFLMAVADTHYGETALKELIRAVAPYCRQCEELIKCLLDEGLMFKDNGVALLTYFFTMLPYEYSMIIIRFAIKMFWELCSNRAGRMCLEECFVAARDSERLDLENTICDNMTVLAMGQQSNYFLQRVFKRGSEQFKKRVREHVLANIVNFCSHECGNYVVQACFLHTPSSLQGLFHAFLDLSDHELAELVRGEHSNYVIRNLLRNGQEVMECQAQTRVLTMRIERLPADVLEAENARNVTRVVRSVLPGN